MYLNVQQKETQDDLQVHYEKCDFVNTEKLCTELFGFNSIEEI